jgi:hypothetical protein
VFGFRVEPKGLREWLLRRGLHLPCLCAAAAPAGETRSCRIVIAHDENVYAFCAYYPTRCNFFSTSEASKTEQTHLQLILCPVHVTAIYRSTTLTSYYHDLPTTSKQPGTLHKH